MRISTNTIFDGGSARLMGLQAKMDRIAQQVSTGRKILSPSDDPVAAARALETEQSAAVNEQYTKNRASVRNTLSIAEGALGSVVDTLQSIHEQVINAGNAVLSDADRQYIATTLQGQLDQLVSLANATDGAGHYIFAGNESDKPPISHEVFDPSSGVPTAIENTSDTETRMVQVDTSRLMPMNLSGKALFKVSPDASKTKSLDIFKHLQDTISTLKDPASTSTQRKDQLVAMGNSFTETLKTVSDQRSALGIHLQQLDSIDSVGADRANQYAQTLSDLQDLDYNQALSDLSRQQLALQAAQKTFQQTTSLSLFNYIN